MSIKSFIQIIILTLMISIIVGVYYKYFQSNENIVEEINSSDIYNQEQLKILEKKVLELEIKNNKLNSIIKKDKDIVLSSPEWLVVLPKSLIKLEKKL